LVPKHQVTSLLLLRSHDRPVARELFWQAHRPQATPPTAVIVRNDVVPLIRGIAGKCPIPVMGDISVPGGQEFTLPPP